MGPEHQLLVVYSVSFASCEVMHICVSQSWAVPWFVCVLPAVDCIPCTPEHLFWSERNSLLHFCFGRTECVCVCTHCLYCTVLYTVCVMCTPYGMESLHFGAQVPQKKWGPDHSPKNSPGSSGVSCSDRTYVCGAYSPLACRMPQRWYCPQRRLFPAERCVEEAGHVHGFHPAVLTWT